MNILCDLINNCLNRGVAQICIDADLVSVTIVNY